MWFFHRWNALCAALTASWASLKPQSDTFAISPPVAGSNTGNVDAADTQRPSMKPSVRKSRAEMSRLYRRCSMLGRPEKTCRAKHRPPDKYKLPMAGADRSRTIKTKMKPLYETSRACRSNNKQGQRAFASAAVQREDIKVPREQTAPYDFELFSRYFDFVH